MQVLSSEDAQLQARIWNRFVKKRPISGEDQDAPFTVTAEILDNAKFRTGSSDKSDNRSDNKSDATSALLMTVD